MSECLKCGKLIKSDDSYCNECNSLPENNLQTKVETMPNEKKDIGPGGDPTREDNSDGIQVKITNPEPDEEMMDNNASRENMDDSDQSLDIEDDLIKVEPAPSEAFEEEDTAVSENDQIIEQTTLSEQIEHQNTEDVKNSTGDEQITGDLKKITDTDSDPEFSTDKVYAMSDSAVSSVQKEELISSLQTKVPNIIKKKMNESVQEPQDSSQQEDWTESGETSQQTRLMPREDPTQIIAPPPLKSDPVEKQKTVFYSGNKLHFPYQLKIPPGEKFNFQDEEFLIAKKQIDKKTLALASGLGLVLIILAITLLPQVLTTNTPATMIGVVMNAETKAVIPNVQVVIDALDIQTSTNQFGMIEFNDMKPGNYNLTASKPQFKTAGLGFSISNGKTSVVTLELEPSVPAVKEPVEAEKKETRAKPPSYGKLEVITNVPDARVIVDDNVLGTSNKTYSRLYSGRHKLVVTKEGYKEHSQTVNVNTNKTTRVEITLEEIETAYNPKEIQYEEYLEIADNFASNGKWREAAGNYTMALAKHEDGDIYLKRSQAYQELDQKNQALNDLFKAADYYTKISSHTQALACYDKILRNSPGNQRALRERGFAHLRNGEYQPALKDLKQAVDLNDDSFQNQIAYGEALYILGEYKDALKHLKKARGLDEHKARPYALSALASMARGKDKDASKYYREFQERANAMEREEFSSDPDWNRLIQMVSQSD